MPPRRGEGRTADEVLSAQAQDAYECGAGLLAAGDPAAALPWLERARRIARDDDTVALSLAVARFATGRADALPLLEDLSRRIDTQPLWLALAAARHRAGDAKGAAAALATALARFRLDAPEALEATADAIVAASGAAGWCAMLPDDTTLARPGAAGRRIPPDATVTEVLAQDGRPLLGSPLQVARLREVEGCVAATPEGGVSGWAWHPADPARPPDLTVTYADGSAVTLRAEAEAEQLPRPLTRPRRIALPPSSLGEGPVRITGPDGRALAGSPLDPGQPLRAARAAALAVAHALPATGRARLREVPWQPMPAALAAPPATAAPQPDRPVAIVMPAYRGLAETRACLDALRATVPPGTEIVAVDDASPEPALAAMLDEAASAGALHLVRHASNKGFPTAANAGLRHALTLPGERDIVLLNSDAVPTPGWLDRLREAVHAAPDIGTACPLSNDASILGYPDPDKPAPPPLGAALHALAATAAAALDGVTVDLPTAVGFCMYIRRECLLQTGLLRADLFAQGYGEENDFCLRARKLGWRHVAVPAAFVAHASGTSFGAARPALLARNLDVLEALHPGYRALIAAWQARDPLAPARRALDAARLLAAHPPTRRAVARPVLLVTHNHGGGVERVVQARAAALADAGTPALLIRPVPATWPGQTAEPHHRYIPGLLCLGTADPAAFRNLRYRLPEDLADLTALLRRMRPVRMEVHHLLGHDPAVLGLARTLRIPYDVHVHDYAWLCPRITLVGRTGRYCGEPDVAVCDACVADLGSELEDPIAPAPLRARSATQLAGAARVLAPSADAATRISRHFPAIRPTVAPLEDDTTLPPLRALPPATPRHVAVIGGISRAKGYDMLLECARDAAARALPLHFTLLGYSEDDARLLATSRVFVTGAFREDEAHALLAQAAPHLAWLPSVWPETWCFTLGTALRAGLAVAAFDLGAQAERIRRTGRGWLLPLHLSPPAINAALLQAGALQAPTGDVSLPTGTAVPVAPKPVSDARR